MSFVSRELGIALPGRKATPWIVACATAVLACSGGGGGAAPGTTRLPGVPIGLQPAVATLVSEHDRAARSRPEDAEAAGTLGLVYEANHRLEEAHECYRRAFDLAPDNPRWLARAAYALERLGEIPRAVELLDRHAAGFAQDARLQVLWGGLLLEVADLPRARTAFTSARAADAANVEALLGLGAVALRQGQAEEAARHLEQALTLDPDYASLHYQLGLAYRALGRIDEALPELEKGEGAKRRAYGDELDARIAAYGMGLQEQLEKVTGMLSTGRPQQAMPILQKLLAHHADDVHVQVNLGVAHLQMRRLDAALAALQRAEEIDPNEPTVPTNLALCLLEMGRPQEARAAAERAVRLSPNDFMAHFSLGRVLVRSGHQGEARRSLRRAVELQGDSPAARKELADLCMAMGLPAEAVVQFQAIAGIAPNFWRAHADLANALMEVRRWDEAAQALARARRLAPRETSLNALEERLSRR